MRKRVPAALQAEVTEYASLLRALRTSASQDLVPHLVRDSSPKDDSERLQALTPRVSTSPAKRSSPPGQELEIGDERPTKRRKATMSTRWPHLPEDVNVPEWGFEDEIRHLVSQQHAHMLAKGLENHQLNSDHDSLDDETEVPPNVVSSTSSLATAYLSSILALIVAHTPGRVASMQNRIVPIDWRTVLDMSSSTVIPADPLRQRCLSKVRKQLQSFYASEEERHDEADDNDIDYDEPSLEGSSELKQLEASLFESPVLALGRGIPKPDKRKKAKGGTSRSRGRKKQKPRDER